MDSPRPAGAARPPMVTAAAVLLIITGALSVLFSLLLFGRGIFLLFALISLVIGALEIYAGVNVLGLREVGRRIGLVVAGVAILMQLLQITSNLVPSIIGIAINGFVIYALTQYAGEFQS